MHYDRFESIDRADKKALREVLNKMLAEFLANGGQIEKLGQPGYEELMSKRAASWTSGGTKKPPNKFWEKTGESKNGGHK